MSLLVTPRIAICALLVSTLIHTLGTDSARSTALLMPAALRSSPLIAVKAIGALMAASGTFCAVTVMMSSVCTRFALADAPAAGAAAAVGAEAAAAGAAG